MGVVTWLTLASLDWQVFLTLVEHDSYHLSEYVAACARFEKATALAFTWADEAGGYFFLPLLFRKIPGTDDEDATSPYGYPGPAVSPGLTRDQWLAACQALKAELAARQVRSCFVRLNPLLPADLEAMATVGTLVHHGSTIVMDLRLTEEQVLAGIRSNHRRDIRRGHREGRTATIDTTWEHLPQFVELYHETMRRVGAAPRYFFPLEYFEALHDELGEHVHLVVVHADGEVAAGAVLLEEGGIVQYHLGGTLDRYLPQQPAKLFFDRAWRWAKGRGDTRFHLGGGVGGGPDTLFRFKQGFSKVELPFHTWRIVPSRPEYEALVRRHLSREPGLGASTGDEGVFPAYRALT